MVQDTRKDPRAKVLTMTVRYKSATIDEFIEHHSHDVSRGGIFIKTPSPFPPGTLLKFEIRISEDKPVLGGVGRVVWKRDPPQASNERPAGMGVKFLKIDDSSRGVIDRIVTTKGDGPSEFESGGGDGPEAPAPSAGASSPPAAQPARAVPSRKATMLGLGVVTAQPAEQKTATPSNPPQPDKFFPDTKSVEDMPPPEERTVMRQAAELLAEALKGAGGSLEEIGAAPAPKAEPKPEPQKEEPKEEPKPAVAAAAEVVKEAEPDKPKEEPKAEASAADKGADDKVEAKAEEKPEGKIEDKPAKTDEDKKEEKASAKDAEADAAKAEVKEPEKKEESKKAASDKPADDEDHPRRKEPKPVDRGESRTTPAVAAAAENEAGGSKLWLYMLIVIGGIVGIWYWKSSETPETTTAPAASATQAPKPPPVELPKLAVEAAAPVAAEAAAPVAAAAEAGAPEAAASVATTPAAKPPKPEPTAAATTPPAPKPPAPTVAPKPPAPKPETTTAPAPKPPAPKPKPTSDNPY